MSRILGVSMFLALAIGSPWAVAQHAQPASDGASRPEGVLWRNPVDIERRDLFNGPGGRDGWPQGRLTFLEEDMAETKPKFLARDEKGVEWKIKLGAEARPEVAATRLVWAAGYFVDENYYLAVVNVDRLPRLRRGAKYVSDDGSVRGARLERHDPASHKLGKWAWFENPFVGTPALDGLRVLMALINSWDLSTDNNSIRARNGVARAYYVGDLGSSFGNTLDATSRGDAKGYEAARFIRQVSTDSGVSFELRRCIPFGAIFYPSYYVNCLREKQVVEDIPLAHVRWIAAVIGRLSAAQIADAFRAAGYSPAEIQRFTVAVLARIAALKELRSE